MEAEKEYLIFCDDSESENFDGRRHEFRWRGVTAFSGYFWFIRCWKSETKNRKISKILTEIFISAKIVLQLPLRWHN